MLRLLSILLLALVVAPAQELRYGLGRPADEADVAAPGIAVLPDGAGLPEGEGTAKEGLRVYETNCRECHGPEGKGAEQTALVGAHSDLQGDKPKKTVGSYWPYATTLWDYTNRAMPFDRPGTLTSDQVYAVSAYILHLNGLIGEEEPMNAKTLPMVVMPNREGFRTDRADSRDPDTTQ